MHGVTRRRPSRCPTESGTCWNRRSGSATHPCAELEPDQVRLRPSALSPADRDALAEHRRHRALRRRRPRPAAARGRQVHARPAAHDGIPVSRTRRTQCCCPATKTRSPRSCRLCGAAQHRRRPVRRRHQRGGRPRSAARRVQGRDIAGPAQAERTALASTRSPVRPNWVRASPGPEAERLLGERGFSLGHFPQSFQFATIGGFAATRSSGQDSAGYGRFNDMVRGLRAVTPAGVLDLGRAPESAAGPDLRQLMIGSEGVFGIITRVRVRVHPAPAATRYEAWSFPDFATGADALRAVTQTGNGPDRHPAVRRGRDRRQPGHHREHRRGQRHRRLPGDHRVRGDRGARREQARRDPGGDGGPRRHVARRGACARMGTRPLQRAVPARLAAVGGRVVRNARDRHQLVQHSRAEIRRDRGADHRAGRNRHAGTWCCATFRMCIPPARRCTSPSSPGSAAIRSSSGARRRPPHRMR